MTVTKQIVMPKAQSHVRAPERGLTDREMRFVDEYVIDFKGAQSAVRAGYSSKKSDVQAARLLRRPEVQAEIALRQSQQAARCSKTAQEVVEELVKLGFSNMDDYITVNAQGLPYVDLGKTTAAQRSAIQKITVESYVEKGQGADGEVEEREVKKVKLELYDRRAALVDLGKHLGVFKENKDTTPQDFEFTISIGTRSGPNGSEAAAKVSIRPSMGVSETE